MNNDKQRSQDGLEPFRHGKITHAVVPVKQTTTRPSCSLHHKMPEGFTNASENADVKFTNIDRSRANFEWRVILSSRFKSRAIQIESEESIANMN
jgi:hypothetical protein